MKKYTPNGTPLTPYERELLTILQEECAEVIVAASKLLRFGKENHPSTHVNNMTQLGLECGDLLHMITRVGNAKLLKRVDVNLGVERKKERLAMYLQATPENVNA